MNEDDILEVNYVSSSASFRISLESIRNGEHGLNEARRKLLQRVPETGDWALYPRDSISIKDLAYISAKVRHEFALLRGKRKDILFHGSAGRCDLGGELIDLLRTRKYRLVAHTHPDYDFRRNLANRLQSGWEVQIDFRPDGVSLVSVARSSDL